jgi:hypothetical protein
MRWHYHEADIDTELRKTFERHGVVTMQMILANDQHFRHKGNLTSLNLFDVDRHVTVQDDLFSWLTEQHDIEDTEQTWSLTMEIAITVLVAAELVVGLWQLAK